MKSLVVFGPAAHDDVMPSSAHVQRFERVPGDHLGLILRHPRGDLIGDHVHRLARTCSYGHETLELEDAAGSLDRGDIRQGHESSFG